MRNRIIQVVAAATVLLATTAANPAAAVVALDVVNHSTLGFGQIVATTSSGAVTVSPAGGRSGSGSIVLASALGVSAATFAVTGEPNTAYSITLPSSATLVSGGSTMTADGFTSSPSGAGNLGPTGTQSVTLGATLHVGAAQTPASYSGTYSLTLAYD